MRRTRILFSIEDFKTQFWGRELSKYNCEIVHNGKKIYSPIIIIISGFFQGRKIHGFVFRYLNDNESLYESTLFFLRDFLTIFVCKILGVKIIWLMHNIDEETHHNHPILSRIRRKMVGLASNKIFVTDPNLVEVAERYGIKKKKLDWTCFGEIKRGELNQKNVELKEKIVCFKELLMRLGNSNIIIGLCVSEPAKKKNHYLRADSIIGKCEEDDDYCVGLVMIGNYPEGREFESAKERMTTTPYILLIEESFSVNEEFISEQIDFFYRGLTDQSVAYTLYVAAGLGKPMIVQNTGALPLIVDRENLGYVIDDKETGTPDKIVSYIQSWNPDYTQPFLKERSWEIGAKKLLQAIQKNEDD